MIIHKTYLSRATSRLFATDLPFGDPLAGPDSRQKGDTKTIVGVGLGVAAVATGGMALAAAPALLSMEAVTAGAMMAGGAMTAVGTVTGNKTLTTIGAVVGMAGGVAGGIQSLASSSAAAAEGTSAATYADALTAGSADAATGSAAGAAAGNAADAAAGSPYTYTAATDGSNIANPGVTAEDVFNPAQSNLVNSKSINPLANMPGYNASGDVALPGSSVAASPTDAASAAQPYISNGNGTGLRAPSGMNPLTPQSDPGILSNVMDIIKKNPDLVNIGAKTVGGIASVMDPKNQATVNYANSAADLNSAKADAAKYALQQEIDRRARLNAGYLNVNQAMPQNLSAKVLTPGSGLINGAQTA